MASRKGPGGDVGALTAELRSQLRQFITFSATVNAQLKDLNQMHSELDDDHKPLVIVKGRLDRAYDEQERLAIEEVKRIDRAVETLDMLMAMQAAAEQPMPTSLPPPPPVAPAIPILGGNKRGPYKKKIKPEPSSTAASPAASAPSPLPSHSPSSSTSALPKPVRPAKKLTKSQRKEMIQQQLPLTPGRRVAFHQKPSAGAQAEGAKEEGWILAQITECIGGDPNKYRVQDVEYDPASMQGDGVFTTTLKSIIPLPDKHGKFMYDILQGSAVMALYPDTTSFYRAVIVSGPEMVHAEKGKKKERVYNVLFDDDDNQVRRISVEMVVEMP